MSALELWRAVVKDHSNFPGRAIEALEELADIARPLDGYPHLAPTLPGEVRTRLIR